MPISPFLKPMSYSLVIQTKKQNEFFEGINVKVEDTQHVLCEKWHKNIVILSGGFDPVHIGHIRMFREASQFGHYVIVGLNSDDWLTRKKGKPFMCWEERKEVLESIRYVNQVLPFDDSDDTASDIIRKVANHYWDNAETDDTGFFNYYSIYFANGGDRGKGNVPEIEVCKDVGVEMLWGVGGGKVQSSSDLIKNSE